MHAHIHTDVENTEVTTLPLRQNGLESLKLHAPGPAAGDLDLAGMTRLNSESEPEARSLLQEAELPIN